MANNEFAILSSVIALTIGLGLVYLCKRLLKIDTGALLVAVLFAPVIFYLGLSGRLVEFKGLGIEAKFQEIAGKTITPTNIKPVSSSASAIKESEEGRALLGIGSEVVLLTASETKESMTHKRAHDVALKIYPGLLQGNFEMLVVVNEANKVLGYFDRYFFLDLLRIEVEQTIRGSRSEYDEERVKEQLEQTQLWDIVEQPELRAEAWGRHLFIQSTATNAETFKQLKLANQDAAVVVDEKDIYAGIVRRKDITSDLLLTLIQPGKE